jgi:hypothetical protein
MANNPKYAHQRTGAIPALSGRSLAHRRLDPYQKTNMVIRAYEGHFDLADLTLTQLAAMFGVSVGSIYSERYRRKQWSNPVIEIPGPASMKNTTATPAVRAETVEVTTNTADSTADPATADIEIDSLIDRFGVDRILERVEKKL